MTDFKFNREDLSRPRPPGISAYLRVKNEQQLIRLCIESHIDFYDEIIVAHNDCADRTPAIINELANKHAKIKVFEYAPKVHPTSSAEHKSAPTESVNSLANYYNWTMAKCNYSYATKLDADHLAIPANLAPAISQIRNDIAAGKRKLYFFSGINLIRCNGEIMCGGKIGYPFSGQGDILYHPVNPSFHFHQKGSTCEKFTKLNKRHLINRIVFLGQLYFHLHYLKPGREIAFGEPQDGVYKDADGKHIAMPWDEFISPRNYQRMLGQMKFKHRMQYKFHNILPGKPKWRITRMLRLPNDLANIDFQRDALRHLKNI